MHSPNYMFVILLKYDVVKINIKKSRVMLENETKKLLKRKEDDMCTRVSTKD